jgi:hypothetical protein
MDQKTIVLYLHMKGMTLDAIHEDLMRMFGKQAAAYFTVTQYVRNAQFPPKTQAGPPGLGAGGHSTVYEAVLVALGEYTFSFVGELSRLSGLLHAIVHRHLPPSLRFAMRHLQWALHFLTAEQKMIRVDISDELLQVLSAQMNHP